MSNISFDIKPLSLNEKIDFFTELYTYLKSSIPISTALTKIMKYAQSYKIKRLASLILYSLDSGEDFAVAILKFKIILGNVYCNLLAIGAQAGELPKITQDILNSLKKQRTSIRNVIKACAYPGILCVMLIGAVLTLFFFIVPRVAAQAEMLSGKVPPLLAALNFIAAILSKSWIVLFIFIGFAIWLAVQLFKSMLKSQYILRVPLIGNIIKIYNLSVFSKILSISYAAGVPITNGILLSAEAASNDFIRKKLFKCSAMISRVPLSESLAMTGLFTPQMLSKVESGEMTGNLDEMLNEISNDIDEHLDTIVASVLKLIEPVLMIIIGGFILVYGLVIMGATNPFAYL